MHPMAFVQKRAHLSAVARGREMFAGVEDMTPARFDILYVIHEQWVDVVAGLRSHSIEQARIHWLLGLRRQTVWQVVERLVALGLVKKDKARFGDTRRNILSLTDEGVRRVHQAMGAAFSERLPVPKDAPVEPGKDVPRYWRRPELADVRYDILGEPVLPKKVGREVGKIYSAFARKMVGPKDPKPRHRYLQILDDMIMDGIRLAQALGDTSTMIYPVWEPYFTGPPKCVREEARRKDDGSDKRFCEVPIRRLPGARSLPMPEAAPSTKRCRPRRPPHRYRKCRRLPETVSMPVAKIPSAIALSA